MARLGEIQARSNGFGRSPNHGDKESKSNRNREQKQIAERAPLRSQIDNEHHDSRRIAITLEQID